ncbi:MAG TPA: c-type cytochrome [Pyrinomonadaceae bacterium]|jgi:hypothetical protein
MSKERVKRGVVCAALALAASGALWGRAALSQGPAAGDKPVEQTRKNIQVLKGLPESQLIPEMNFISAALGVQCGFCHVNKGRDPQTGQTNWVWESDEKEEKKVARDMMRMVLTVNSGDFGLSRGQVTCYTCHRGQEHPQNLPALPLAAPAPGARPTPPAGGGAAPAAGAPAAGAPATGAAPGATAGGAHTAAAASRPELPTVQQVFDRYVAAVGAPAAVARFQTQAVKGTITGPQGRAQNYEVTVKGADRFLLVTEGQQGKVTQALNGPAGWILTPREGRALNPLELANARRSAESLAVLKFTPAATMRVGGRRKVGDRDAIVVIDRPSEMVQRRYFFDAETGLLVRVVTLTDAVLNQIPEQVDYEDYRDVEGVKMPFTVRFSSVVPLLNQTRAVAEVRPGVAVEDALFAMPKK